MAASEGLQPAEGGEACGGVIRVGAQGRLGLPAAVRERMAIRDGDLLLWTITADGALEVRSAREQARRLQGIYAHLAPGVSLVDELIRERREEARSEAEE